MSQSGKYVSGGPSPGSAIETITGNTGGAVPPTAGNVDLITAHATVLVAGNPGASTLTMDFGITNLVLGSSLSSLAGGTANVGLGDAALFGLTSGSANVAIGYGAAQSLTSGGENTIIGSVAGFALTNTSYNVAIGYSALGGATGNNMIGIGRNALNQSQQDGQVAIGYGALSSNTTGARNIAIGNLTLTNSVTDSNNTFIGDESGGNLNGGSNNTGIGQSTMSLLLTTGSNNTAIGYTAGNGFTTSDSNNIAIGSFSGGGGVSNTTWIGNGSTATCYVYGITGVTVSNPEIVTINSATGQLGVAGSSGGFIQTITGNSGGAESPSAGNFNIVTANSTVKFAGSAATETLDFGITNIVLGSALPSLAGGIQNVGIGNTALSALTSGSTNVAIGVFAGTDLTSGSNNTLIGWSAGANYVGAETNNIIVGYNIAGTAAESNKIRIGNSSNNACYITGIDGVNVGSVATVVTEASNQLGTAVITAGTGISVVAGANTITINNTGAGFTWHDVTGGSATLAAQNGYLADSGSLTTFTMSSNNAIGDTIKIVGKGSGGWKIVYTTNQNIIFGSSTSTTTTGNIASTNQNDCVELVCTTASATQPIFTVVSSIGNISIT